VTPVKGPRPAFSIWWRVLLVASLLLAAATATACASDRRGSRAEAGQLGSQLSLAVDGVPAVSAHARGATVEMGTGSYCWHNLCRDFSGPVTRGTLSVNGGDSVAVGLPQVPLGLRKAAVLAGPAVNGELSADGAQLWSPTVSSGAGTELDYTIEDGRLKFASPLQPGLYVVTVALFYERGDLSYGVLLDVSQARR
jgi:hypothetical protein